MKTGLYPGCSLTGTSREYNESVRALTRALGIQLEEVDDWNCCGASAAHNLNHELAVALPARILAKAHEQQIEDLLIPCAACYNRLTVTSHELKENKELRQKVAENIQNTKGFEVSTSNVLQFIEKQVLSLLDGKITRPFAHKVACYYGCLLTRPGSILKTDRAEDPVMMDQIMQKIGAETIDWPFKTECCGAGLTMSHPDIVASLSGKIIEDAEHRGAEAIIVACPMCHANLDMRRNEINKRLGRKINVPVIYITQAIGYSIGLGFKELGLQRHFVPVEFLKN